VDSNFERVKNEHRLQFDSRFDALVPKCLPEERRKSNPYKTASLGVSPTTIIRQFATAIDTAGLEHSACRMVS
jgi:hypothetical protein